jgi:Transposase DDE domain
MFEELMNSVGVQVVTKLKRNMKQRLMSLDDRLLLRKRAVVETVVDQLKNISQLEHSRHRSPVNCFVNILCGLIAYCHQSRNRYAEQFDLFCLTRTHVRLRFLWM